MSGSGVPATPENPLLGFANTLPHEKPILLGSGSFTRKLILTEMGLPFHKVVRSIDEQALGDRSGDRPEELVLTLANAKMDRLIEELQNGNIRDDELPPSQSQSPPGDTVSNDEWIVLTGDQVVTCQGRILEKPTSTDEAKEFVSQYGKNPPSTVGSCVLHHVPSNVRVAGVDTATIYFKEETLTPDAASALVNALVEAGEPVLSCAGGLMIEHPLVQDHVQRIDGTQDSVMGLSKALVLKLLQELADKLSRSNE